MKIDLNPIDLNNLLEALDMAINCQDQVDSTTDVKNKISFLIATKTLSELRENIMHQMQDNGIHYGYKLAEAIRESTKDLNKLSRYDKFVLHNGYRYKTREEFQLGYYRWWKSDGNILIYMEEFLAEAEKKSSDPAADTYNALVSLVEAKKLRPGEVYNYAHFRWCLDSPEAIVAWQTGQDKWTVNNCDTEITEEAARIKVCEEWGFEIGRVRIIGTPYYDATDYQFIRFNCAHMAWLWQNGNLLQVYC